MSPETHPSMLDRLAGIGVIPVVTVENPDQAVMIADALSRGGLPAAEITFRAPGAAEAVAAVAASGIEIAVGAGTVTTAEQVDAAADAGAQYIVSPGVSPSVVGRAAARGLPAIPGAVTATEIQQAMELGIHTVKFFPASVCGGPEAIKALSAPFGAISFIPTGGITLENLSDYLTLPQVRAAGGSWMVPKDLIAAEDTEGLRSAAAATAEAVRALRA